MNKIILIGRLVKNADKVANGNSTYCRFSMAVDGLQKKDGTDDTLFIDCVAFGKQGELIATQKKGDRLAVVGRLTVHKNTGENGLIRYFYSVMVSEFDFLEKKRKEDFEIKDEDLPF